jgi:hypothetical protein
MAPRRVTSAPRAMAPSSGSISLREKLALVTGVDRLW